MNPRQALAVVALLAAAAGTALYLNTLPRPPGAGAQAAAPAGPTIGGPFSLIGPGGKTVTDTDFRGKFMLIYFGYTHCPDACPTTLGDVATALDKLTPAQRARLATLFITVDPERDTPQVMADYAQAFGAGIMGLTGTPEALRKLEAAYHVYAEKHPLSAGGYAMDHTSILYVIDPQGQFAGVIGDDTKPDDIARRLHEFGL